MTSITSNEAWRSESTVSMWPVKPEVAAGVLSVLGFVAATWATSAHGLLVLSLVVAAVACFSVAGVIVALAPLASSKTRLLRIHVSELTPGHVLSLPAMPWRGGIVERVGFHATGATVRLHGGHELEYTFAQRLRPVVVDLDHVPMNLRLSVARAIC